MSRIKLRGLYTPSWILIIYLYRHTGFQEIHFLHASAALDHDSLLPVPCLLVIYAPFNSAEDRLMYVIQTTSLRFTTTNHSVQDSIEKTSPCRSEAECSLNPRI